jgi:hypothetical protein
MASDDETNTTPTFQFDAEQLQNIRETLGITADENPPDNIIIPPEPPKKRRRGRPRKYPISETGTTVPGLTDELLDQETSSVREGTPLPPAKLGKRDEREVSERIANMLLGGTGIASQAKSYLAMTEEEAKAIADPLSSYLVRNADTIPVAQQVLENYDLLAITLGVLAYVVRIYRDRTDEIAEQRANNPNNSKRSLAEIVGEHSVSSNNGQAEGGTNFVSTPYG